MDVDGDGLPQSSADAKEDEEEDKDAKQKEDEADKEAKEQPEEVPRELMAATAPPVPYGEYAKLRKAAPKPIMGCALPNRYQPDYADVFSTEVPPNFGIVRIQKPDSRLCFNACRRKFSDRNCAAYKLNIKSLICYFYRKPIDIIPLKFDKRSGNGTELPGRERELNVTVIPGDVNVVGDGNGVGLYPHL